MKRLLEQTRLDIEIDEAKVGRGSVDWRSIQVRVRRRAPEDDAPVIAALAELPHPVEVTLLRRTDGGVELVPRSWLTLRLGAEGPTLLEMARNTPGGLGPVPQVDRASRYAMNRTKRYQPDLGSYSSEEQAKFLLRTIEQLGAASSSLRRLINHLEYAAPGRKAVPPFRVPERLVMAAVLSEVHDLSTLRIGEELGIDAPPDSAIKGENQTVRKMIHRGRALLERCFGAEEWRAKAERMRAERERWKSMGPKWQFYTLLAEERGTSPEEEERIAIEDGFDEKLDEWFHAYEQQDHRQAMSIQLSDPRFDALAKL
jgi:hypothetical protein